MKIFYSEKDVDYSTYTYSYGVYCLPETHSEISEIYAKGFLPYTGNFKITKDIFYLARSLRIDLNRFKDTSENRRVNRLAEPLQINIHPIEKSAFDVNNEIFREFCTQYARDRFSGGSMESDRIRYIFSGNILTHVLEFRSDAKLYGYVFAAMHGEMLHYWFSFFDLEYLRSHSLGKWMMWRTIHWAKEQELEFVYLGTCYKQKGLYKVRDHAGVEFFDGIGWNQDTKLIKHLCKTDEAEKTENADFLKSTDEQKRKIFGFLY